MRREQSIFKCEKYHSSKYEAREMEASLDIVFPARISCRRDILLHYQKQPDLRL